jgi:hypothetical protein
VERRFEFVPLWAIRVFFVDTPRRRDCSRCGVKASSFCPGPTDGVVARRASNCVHVLDRLVL